MELKYNAYWDNIDELIYANKSVSSIIGWGGVKVFDTDLDIVELCYEYSKAIQKNSCGQCIPCSVGTKQIQDIFKKIVVKGVTNKNLEKIKELSEVISLTSKCQIGQSSPIVFIYLIDRFKDIFLSYRRDKIKKKYRYETIVTAPCIQACPIHLDIPQYIENISCGRFEKSLSIIRDRLPLPCTLGRVCTRPCEENCRRAIIDEPLQIRHLKRFVSDFELERLEARRFKKERSKKLKIAIIGAGPAGLTCAYFLALKGYSVIIFEALSEAGGMAAIGIPDYRLPREILGYEVGNIMKLGVKIIYNKKFGRDFDIKELENKGFKSIFLGLGCHSHKPIGIQGEDKDLVGYSSGIDFLRNINLGISLPKGKKLSVIGGGNVAIDSVRAALRSGFQDVSLVYRRTQKEMPADATEIREAYEEGVRFYFLTAPKRIIEENGVVKGLECLKMELGQVDNSGRGKPIEIKGSQFIIESDVIISAIGQETETSNISKERGIGLTDKKTIIIDENFMTERVGVFAGGDCVTGPDILIRACAQGRLAALKIHNYLNKDQEGFLEEEQERFISKLKIFDPSEHISIPGGIKRIPIKNKPVLERVKDFKEIEDGYTGEEAIEESNRCLRCYKLVTFAYKE